VLLLSLMLSAPSREQALARMSTMGLLNLAVLAGSAAPVPALPEPGWLAGTAIALLILAIAALAGQTMLAGRECLVPSR
jgi:hypothetical protein